MKRTIVTAFVVGFCVFLAQDVISYRAFHPKKIEHREVTIPAGIELADLLMLMQRDDFICIDVREKSYYKYAHIPGAVNWEIEDSLSELLLKKINASANIVVYGNPGSDRMTEAVKILEIHKIAGVKVYYPGWREWKACKLPTETQ